MQKGTLLIWLFFAFVAPNPEVLFFFYLVLTPMFCFFCLVFVFRSISIYFWFKSTYDVCNVKWLNLSGKPGVYTGIGQAGSPDANPLPVTVASEGLQFIFLGGRISSRKNVINHLGGEWWLHSINLKVWFFFQKELDQVESKGISLGKLQMTRKIGRTVNGSLVVFNWCASSR